MQRRPKVVILDTNFPHNDAERRIVAEAGADLQIDQCVTEDQVVAAGRHADALICQYAPLTRRAIEQLERPRVIARYGIGVDNIDVQAATEYGIWVANAPGFCAPEVADHALAMVMAIGRRLFQLDRSVRDGQWDVIGVCGPSLGRVSEETLGIVGFGAIGRELARRARGIGMRVLAHSPRSAADHGPALGVEPVELPRLLRESDYVVLLCPLTPSTRHMINRETLALIRPTASLVNVSRGPLVDEAALVEAIENGRIFAAALDVFETEPPPTDHPLRQHPNVIITPHAAYYSAPAQVVLQEGAARNAVMGMRGRMPPSTLNSDTRPRFGSASAADRST